jgi:hypothetical protein
MGPGSLLPATEAHSSLMMRSNLMSLGRVLSVAASVAALGPAAAVASFPGADGVIAYSGIVDGNCAANCPPYHYGIWALEPRTGKQRQLTAGPDYDPSFSPSGNLLAFQRDYIGGTVIFLARADGSHERPLVRGEEPAFSPDGRQIVFVRATGLFVTGSVPRSPVRALTHSPGDKEPRWSSTGEIAFERTRHASDQLDIITPPSSRVRAVFTYEPPRSTALFPDWSPNGGALAVALCNPGLPLPRASTTAPTLVFRDSCTQDVWAPQGRRLAEPGHGALRGRPNTTCPDSTEGDISWQPLVSRTLRVHTARCEPRSPLPGEIMMGGVEAESSPRDEQTCYTIRHKHRCFTKKVP